MDLHPDDPAFDPETQQRYDRKRLLRALNLSLAFVALLVVVFALQPRLPVSALAVSPRDLSSLLGLLTAPLLHGSVAHLAANATALLILGTLAGSVYPRATVRTIPLMWLASGLGAWLSAGRIVLLPVPGHTPGMTAALVGLDESGEFLLASDAVAVECIDEYRHARRAPGRARLSAYRLGQRCPGLGR